MIYMLSDVVCKYIPILLFAQVFVIKNQNINIYNILQTTFKYMTKI